MKKSVILAVFLLFSLPVLAQMDLPPPPSPPGFGQAAEFPDLEEDADLLEGGLDDVEDLAGEDDAYYVEPTEDTPIPAPPGMEPERQAPIPTEWESRLSRAEAQAEGAAEQVATLESDLQALKTRVANLEQRPAVQQPQDVGLREAVDESSGRALVGILLGIAALIIAIGIAVFVVVERGREKSGQKAAIREYLSAHQGRYPLDVLRAQLRAAGYENKAINDVARELNIYK